MTAKIAMLKGIAFNRKKSVKWFDAFCAVLNRIDNEVRITRNRYVHDVWVHHAPAEAPVKRTYSVQIMKPQSRQRRLTTHIDEAVTADEIWNLVYQVERISVRLKLFACFEDAAFDFVETWR